MKIHKKTKRILSICISALTMLNAVILPLESNLSLPEFKVSAAETEGVAINEENFPDPIFREYVDSKFDTTDDDVLSQEEINAVTKIEVMDYGYSEGGGWSGDGNEGINSLEGIEYFTSLTYLNCSTNHIYTLDLSNNTKLEHLYCEHNSINTININNNVALKTLVCYGNRITDLDTSNNTSLTYLSCYWNPTELDLRNNIALQVLNCEDSNLHNLDISKNINLRSLSCSFNQLTSLDISNNPNLTSLWCQGNLFESIDASNNPLLTTLACDDNLYIIKHKINLIDGKFDLNTISETLDISKVSSWSNASINNNILTVYNPASDISYYIQKESGNYTSYQNFHIIPISCTITENAAAPIKKQNYTGDPIEPEIQITSGNYTLVKDKDYSVSYSNNINPGVATATITTLGDFYKGEFTVDFIIRDYIESLDIDVITPAVGEKPQDTIIAGDNYTAEISWKPYENPFTFNKVYTANIVVTPADTHCFNQNTIADGFNVKYNSDGTLTLTKEFAATAKAKITTLTPPSNVMLTEYYNNANDIIALLPKNIDIESENSINRLPISWKLVGEFNADSEAENIFAWNVDVGELDSNGIAVNGEITVTNTKYVAINATNFPDDIFRKYVDENFDTKDDDILTNDEILDATIINISASEPDKEKISDLKGIEFFTELTYLYCDDNSLTEIDISNNTALTHFSCQYNQLTSLNISQNTNLQEIQCEGNLLTELNTMNNINLYSLNCASNNIADLDLSKNTALTGLICWGNQLENIDLSNNSNLVTIWINSNNLENLNLSNNPKLYELYCGSNKLNILDISNNKELSFLECNYNSLSELDVRNNKSLETLWCSNNKLTTLDISNCVLLTSLVCDDRFII